MIYFKYKENYIYNFIRKIIKMGINEDFAIYLWNWHKYFTAYKIMLFCWVSGFFGIFWDDDDGQMTNACFDLFGGVSIIFPIEYNSPYMAIDVVT